MNKKKNGFTLIEILAVVVIISLISILVIPRIVNSLKNKKGDIDSTTSNMIITAAKLYVSDHASKFDKDDGNIYCLPLTTLTKNEYLQSPVRNVTDDKDITNIMSVKISYDAGFKYEVVNKKDCKINITNKEITYKIGDVVTYNGMNFYVIEDSDESVEYVKLLKAEPLTVDEVNRYGIDEAGVNHVNMYVTADPSVSYYQTAYNKNGYGGVAYYSSKTCGYPLADNQTEITREDCTTDYSNSEIKYILDSWAADKFETTVLKENDLGLKVKLITYEELTTNLECTNDSCSSSPYSWIYNYNYWYWTMDSYESSTSYVWSVNAGGGLYSYSRIYYSEGVVRPVINLYKSAIQ